MSEQDKGNKWWVNAHSFSDRPKTEILRYESIAGKERYKAFLENQQFATEPFPLSTAAVNTDAVATPDWKQLHDIYARVLAPYKSIVRSDKTDFTDLNEGYKLHLNVPVARVQEVSSYLKRENYCHKFLSGGDDPGSVFTLYIGSHRLAFELAKKLSTDLSTNLAKPEKVDEIELAPNIVGRFSTQKAGRYTKYGSGLRGISCLDTLNDSRWITDPVELRRYLEMAFKSTYASLANDYGAYFHG